MMGCTQLPTDNITWHEMSVSKQSRQERNGHRSFTVWLTGLSGAGKSTLANALDATLFEMGMHTALLDGDNLRKGINSNLGFGSEARNENVRRVAEVAKLFVDAGVIVIVAVISPMESEREDARQRFGKDEFFEVFVDCPIAVCQERDPKGLYKKALKGEISDFTGIDSPYERPSSPDVTIQTNIQSTQEGVHQIIKALHAFGVIDEALIQ